jgi:phenylpropionate dioxygenase-like ring-hydroxylating dioxygenase large terminal subunit
MVDELAASDTVDGIHSLPAGYWYVAAPSSQLGTAPLARRVLTHDIVLFRDSDGAAHALLDRCAHRGVQLSKGVVTEGDLACGYHGWRYGGDGRCTHIPSLVAGQHMPGGIGVRTYPTVECDGYVWVWPQETTPSPATPPQILDFAAFNWVQGTVLLDCAAHLAIENNLDWCHAVFAHPGVHYQSLKVQRMGFQDEAYEIRMTDTGAVIFAPPTREASDPLPVNAPIAIHYALPDRVTLVSSTPAGRMLIVLHMIETSPRSCRQEWLMSIGPSKGGAPQITWADAPNIVFEQDRALLESAQLAYDREGARFERSVPADASTLLLRRILTFARAGSWERERARLVQRRVIQVRS